MRLESLRSHFDVLSQSRLSKKGPFQSHGDNYSTFQFKKMAVEAGPKWGRQAEATEKWGQHAEASDKWGQDVRAIENWGQKQNEALHYHSPLASLPTPLDSFKHVSIPTRGLILGAGAGRIRTRLGWVRWFKIVLPCPDELTDLRSWVQIWS